MQPLTIITGILLGTSASIAAGLSVVLLMFYLLLDDHPRLASELPMLVESTVIFLGMTAICAVSFVSLVRMHRWRWLAQIGMWGGLAFIVYDYLPG